MLRKKGGGVWGFSSLCGGNMMGGLKKGNRVICFSGKRVVRLFVCMLKK